MIFLITTIHNQSTRWDRIERELEYNGFGQAIPILATDYNLLKHTDLNQKQLKQQSLTMAYYTACQTAMFLENDQFVVIDDDVKFLDIPIDDFEIQPHHLQYEAPQGFDLCYLTQTEHNRLSAKISSYDEYWNKVESNWWETPITLWSIGFAKRFVEYIQGKIENGLWLGHIDHELMKMCETGQYKFYGSTTQTCIGLSNSDQSEMSKEGSIHLDVV